MILKELIIYCSKLYLNKIIFVAAVLFFYRSTLSFAYVGDNPYFKQLSKFKDSTAEDGDRQFLTTQEVDFAYNKITENNQKLIMTAEEAKVEKDKKADSTIQDSKKDKERQDTNSLFNRKTPKVTAKLGTYSSVRLYYDTPTNINFSASEKRNLGSSTNSVKLFDGKASFHGMPSFSIAIGNDKLSYYRWEVELGYIPLKHKSVSHETNQTDNKGSNFDFSPSNLDVHIVNLSTNHFLQKSIFDEQYMIFAGAGVGIGYAFPSSKYLSSDLLLPTAQFFTGVTFSFTDKSKLSVFYRLFYADLTLYNKTPYKDLNGKLQPFRPIESGYLDFSSLIIQGIGIEYLFYP
jgi:hypothetical protein